MPINETPTWTRASSSNEASVVSVRWRHATALAALLICSDAAAAGGTPPPSTNDITGVFYWELQTAPMQFLTRIWREPDGTLRATSDNLARGNWNTPVSAVFENHRDMRLDFEWGGFLKGTLNPDGSKLDCHYVAGDMDFPFVIDRVDPARFSPDPELTYAPGPGLDDSSQLCGFWNGTLDWNGVKLRQVLRIGRAVDGRVLARLDLPDQGEKRIPITSLERTNASVRLASKSWGIVYSGEFAAASNELRLRFEMGTKNGRVVFHRTEKPWTTGEFATESSLPPSQPHPLDGVWEGPIDQQSLVRRMRLRLRSKPNGQLEVIQSMADDSGSIPTPAMKVEFRSPRLRCEWITGYMNRSSFQATLDTTGRRLNGVFEDSGNLMPVALIRVGPPSGASAADSSVSKPSQP